MVRKHKGRDHSALDANIIEFLMLADSNPTASTIAQGIGMQRASDVAQRLNALFEKGIISKAKLGKRVFWSIVSDADSPSSDDSIALINTPAVDNHCALETDDHTPSATAEANKGSAVSDSDYAAKLIDTLFGTIEHLKSEVAFLREEVKIRDAQLSSVLTPIRLIQPCMQICAPRRIRHRPALLFDRGRLTRLRRRTASSCYQ